MQAYITNPNQVNEISLTFESFQDTINTQREYVDAIYAEFIRRTCGCVGLNNHAVEHKCILLMYTRLLHFLKRDSIQDLAAIIDFTSGQLSELMQQVLCITDDAYLRRLYDVVRSAEWTWSHNQAFLRAMFCYVGVLPTLELYQQLHAKPNESPLESVMQDISNRMQSSRMETRIHGIRQNHDVHPQELELNAMFIDDETE